MASRRVPTRHGCRRKRGGGDDTRTRKVTVYFSPREEAGIAGAAVRSQLSLGAFIAEAAVAAAHDSAAAVSRREILNELSEARGDLRDAWLRMVAAAARLPDDAGAVLKSVAGDVADAADRIDQVTLTLGRRRP